MMHDCIENHQEEDYLRTMLCTDDIALVTGSQGKLEEVQLWQGVFADDDLQLIVKKTKFISNENCTAPIWRCQALGARTIRYFQMFDCLHNSPQKWNIWRILILQWITRSTLWDRTWNYGGCTFKSSWLVISSNSYVSYIEVSSKWRLFRPWMASSFTASLGLLFRPWMDAHATFGFTVTTSSKSLISGRILAPPPPPTLSLPHLLRRLSTKSYDLWSTFLT